MTEPRSNDEIRADSTLLVSYASTERKRDARSRLVADVPALLAALAAERARADEAEAELEDMTGNCNDAITSEFKMRNLLAAERVKVARAEALAETWRYKGEFGWGPWQEGYGPDQEGWVLDKAATELRAALVGGSTEGDSEA